MIAATTRGVWRELETKLRPYIARRVPAGIDPNDVLQDVFIRLHHGQDSLRDEDSFGGWVYRIAQRAIIDQLRIHAKKSATVKGLAEGQVDFAVLPPEADLTQELASCVSVFVARLPSPYREAITLTELESVTQKNAAEMLGVPLSTLKSRVARGRERIRLMFEECCIMSVDSRGRVTQCEARDLSQVPRDCHALAAEWTRTQKNHTE